MFFGYWTERTSYVRVELTRPLFHKIFFEPFKKKIRFWPDIDVKMRFKRRSIRTIIFLNSFYCNWSMRFVYILIQLIYFWYTSYILFNCICSLTTGTVEMSQRNAWNTVQTLVLQINALLPPNDLDNIVISDWKGVRKIRSGAELPY